MREMEENNETYTSSVSAPKTEKKRFTTTFTKKQKIWLTVGGIIIAACFIIPITWMFMNLNNY